MARIRLGASRGGLGASVARGVAQVGQAAPMSGYGRRESTGVPTPGQYAFKVKGTADWDGDGISPPIRKVQ